MCLERKKGSFQISSEYIPVLLCPCVANWHSKFMTTLSDQKKIVASVGKLCPASSLCTNTEDIKKAANEKTLCLLSTFAHKFCHN